MRARAPVRVLSILAALAFLQPAAANAAASGRVRDALVAHASAPSRPASALAASPGATAASSDPACSEDAFVKNGSDWGSTFKWFFSAGTTPDGVTKTAAQRALRRAVANITGSQNDCKLADQVGASAAFQGRTIKKPNVTTSSGCGKPDGKSVIGFGQLAPSDLGLTCFWTKNGKTVEADVKLNKTNFEWYVKKPSPCVGKFNVEAVATHELGHAFGLDHVSEVTDGHLTMSPLIAPCQHQETSLGLGDVKGLRSIY